jgi:hypothetical protein
MFWITVTSKSYTLRIKPITEENGQPDLNVILEYTGPENHRLGNIIEARIDANRLVEWIVTQLIWAEFIGQAPGVTILRSPNAS